MEINGTKATVINIATGKSLECKNEMYDMTSRKWWALEPQ